MISSQTTWTQAAPATIPPARSGATIGFEQRVGRLLRMHANHREEIDDVFAGDIVAAVGLKHTRTGDTLALQEKPVLLEAMNFAEPVIYMAIEPKTKADQDKLGDALKAMADEALLECLPRCLDDVGADPDRGPVALAVGRRGRVGVRRRSRA